MKQWGDAAHHRVSVLKANIERESFQSFEKTSLCCQGQDVVQSWVTGYVVSFVANLAFCGARHKGSLTPTAHQLYFNDYHMDSSPVQPVPILCACVCILLKGKVYREFGSRKLTFLLKCLEPEATSIAIQRID